LVDGWQRPRRPRVSGIGRRSVFDFCCPSCYPSAFSRAYEKRLNNCFTCSTASFSWWALGFEPVASSVSAAAIGISSLRQVCTCESARHLPRATRPCQPFWRGSSARFFSIPPRSPHPRRSPRRAELRAGAPLSRSH